MRRLIDSTAPYSDARYHRQQGSSISLVNGEVAGKSTWVSEGGYLVRSFKNGILTAFSSNEPRTDKLEVRAKSWEEGGFKPVVPVERRVVVPPQAKPVEDVSLEDKIKILKELDSLVRGEKIKSKLIRFNISLTEFREERALYNTEALTPT